MSAGRPGGLTALAVMNFIFGGLGLVQVLGLGAMLARHHADPEVTRAKEEIGKMLGTVGVPVLVAYFSLASLAAVLQIVAGLGYLRQKRFLGRVLGNTFALLSITANVTIVTASREVEGMGLTLGALLGVVYPLLTLLLINTTFREDLVN